jgi:hypothetical protein
MIFHALPGGAASGRILAHHLSGCCSWQVPSRLHQHRHESFSKSRSWCAPVLVLDDKSGKGIDVSAAIELRDREADRSPLARAPVTSGKSGR